MAAGLSVLSVLVLSASAMADAAEPLPVHVELESTSACKADALEAELRELVRRPFTIDADAPTTLRVSVTPGDRRMHARASFTGRAGSDARDLEGRTCTEVFQAVALVASTWIEAEPTLAPPPATALPSPPVEAEAAAARPALQKTAPFDADDPVWKLSWGEQRRPPKTRLGSHLTGFVGLSDRAAVGVDVMVSHRWGGDRHEVRAGLRGLLSWQTRDGGDVLYVLAEALFDGCENVLRGRVTAGPCVRVDPGALHVRGGEQNHVLPWLGLAGGGHAGVRAGKTTLELDVFVGAPVTGYRLERDHATLVPFRSLTFSIGAGASFSIL